jgi:Domain of unknown function (DUF4389)
MSTRSSSYPMRVEGRLDPQLSRGLWLVKWLLVIPHAICLAFLWIAFFVVSVAAFFSILFTGRYPRGLFDFNVGVLRWTWRVGFYAFNANGTDRYPPFTLHEAEYPAALSVEYPAELSRGLVLVKWWLLAIPHYLVVALFVGGVWYGTHWGGAIALLVFFAVVALLFTGRYPRGIFDLVLGMNRWALRVAAYAGLMTDVYPPFRLDMGPTEPGVAIPATGPATRSQTASSTSGVIMTVLGALGVLVGLAITAGGAGVLWVDQTQRDGQGFVMSPSEHLSTTGYAITAGYQRTSDALETRSLGVDLNGPSWLFNRDRLGTLRIHLRGAGHPVFVGIATTTAADRYLSGVGHASLTGFRDGSPSYATQSGHQPSAPPAAQRFWASSASGRGDVALSWRVQRGNWTIVIMNADAAKGISADARLGARLGFLGELSAGLLATGLISGALAATLMILGIRRLNRASHTQ